MAQGLLLSSGATGVALAAIPCRRSAVDVTPSALQCYGNTSVAIAPLLFRSRLNVERQLLLNAGHVSQFPGASIKSTARRRLSAFAELQSTSSIVEQVAESSERQLSNAALASGPNPTELSESSPRLFDAPQTYPATIDAPSPPAGPELSIPGPTSSPVLPSVDVTTTQIPAPESDVINSPGVVESAAQSGSDILEAAGEAVANPEPSEPLSLSQRYESLLNGKNGIGGASKAAVKDGGETTLSITDTLTAAQESVTKTITDLQEAVRDSVDSAGKYIKDAYENVNGSIKGSINSVTDLYDKTLEDIQTSIDTSVTKAGGEVADFTSVFRTGTPLNNQLKEVVIVVKGATGTALEAAGKVLTDIYGSTRVLLPPEVQSSLSVAEQKLQELSAPLGNFLQQAYGGLENVERSLGIDPDNPVIPTILVVGGSLYLGVSYWQGKYGGYSGDLPPSSALDLLKKEGNVVLVDIRPQELRESEGIPDLRRGARSRSAAVEVIKVEGSLRSRLTNAKEIDSILTAAVIRNLKSVKSGTKVIVMDADGSQSKEVARALRKFGLKKRYKIDGGYKAWTAAGLRTKIEGTDSPISILKEDAEEIVEEVKPTPSGVILAALGLVAGIYAAFEWEKTLQLLGVIGIGQVIYFRANSYESVEDVKADFRLLQKPFQLAGQGIMWVVGQVEPATLQLATSPSTSAVQDRVVQAAAKHGPLASEEVEVEAETEAEFENETSTPPLAEEPVPTEPSLEEVPPPPVSE